MISVSDAYFGVTWRMTRGETDASVIPRSHSLSISSFNCRILVTLVSDKILVMALAPLRRLVIAAFVLLTRPDGQPIYVARDQIHTVTNAGSQAGVQCMRCTAIGFQGPGSAVFVRESVSQVMRLLQD